MRQGTIRRRRRPLAGALPFAFAAGLWLALVPTPASVQAAGLPLAGKTIVIDSGHGDIDAGAVGPAGTPRGTR
jgi:N-acetylmuramoyl-L-alanine amidase